MSRTLTIPAVVLLALPLLAGCGGGDPAADPGTTDSSATQEPTPEPTQDVETEETEPAGERLQVGVGSLALPPGWDLDRTEDSLASSPSGASVVALADLGAVGPVTVKQLGRALETGTGAEDPELAFDVELDGEPGFAVRETDLGGQVAHYLFGSIKDGQAVQVLVTLSTRDFRPREHPAFLDEVVASYSWSR